MEPQGIQVIRSSSPGKAQVKDTATGSDDSNKASSSKKGLFGKEETVADVKKFVLAAIVASSVYFIAVAAMSDAMNYFLKHFIGLIIGVLFLAAFRAVQTTPAVIGTAVALWLSLLFIYNISNHYLVSPNRQSSQASRVVFEKGHPADSVVALKPGRYSLRLNPGAATRWMKLPYGAGLINYQISSPNYEYLFIISGKKEVYRGGKNANVPLEVGVPFKIQALGDETITIVITRV